MYPSVVVSMMDGTQFEGTQSVFGKNTHLNALCLDADRIEDRPDYLDGTT